MDVNVNAALTAKDELGADEPVRLADLRTSDPAAGPGALDATAQAQLARLDSLITAVATAAAQATQQAVMEAIRDRIGSHGVGVPEAGSTNALLREVRDAVQSISIDADQINIDTTALDLNTDQLEGIMNNIGAAIGTTADADTAQTLIGRVKRLITDFGAEDFATAANQASAKAVLDSILLAVDGLEMVLAAQASLADKQPVRDEYGDGQALPDQLGADAVLTFTFAAPVNLVLVEADGGDVRVDPFGGVPAIDTGVRARDATPTYIPKTVTEVKVWAATGTVVSVAGFRYA